MQKKHLLGSILLTLTAIIWGTAFVFQRMGMDDIGPVTFTAARMTLAAVAVGVVSIFTKFGASEKGGASDTDGVPAEDGVPEAHVASAKKTVSRNTILGGIVCGIFLAAASIFQQAGIVYTTAGKAGFITALYMLLVPIINLVIFRKKSPWLVWLGVFLGIVGMYFLCIQGDFRLAYGDALIAACAVLFSCQILCCDHFARRGNPVRIAAIQFTVTAVISWAMAFLMETPTGDAIRAAAFPILYCGIVSAGIGYTLQMVAQRYTDPTVASLLMSLEAVFAAIAGVLILHEEMTVREVWGCVIMFVAIVIVEAPGKKME